MLGRRRRPAPRSTASCTRTRESYRISWPCYPNPLRIRARSTPGIFPTYSDSSIRYRCRAPHCQNRGMLLILCSWVLFAQSQLAGTRHAEPRDRYMSVP